MGFYNNPVNYYDPTGHFMISTSVLIGAIIGVVVGGAIGYGRLLGWRNLC